MVADYLTNWKSDVFLVKELLLSLPNVLSSGALVYVVQPLYLHIFSAFTVDCIFSAFIIIYFLEMLYAICYTMKCPCQMIFFKM